MTRTYIIENGQKPTGEQLAEVECAKDQPIVFDDDCPELSDAMMKAFKCAIEAPADPFYSESNKRQLKKSDEQLRTGYVREKTIDELEALEDE